MGIALVRTDGIIIEANQLFRNIIGLAKTSGSGNDENAASFLGRVAESSKERVIGKLESAREGKQISGPPVEIHFIGDQARSTQFGISPIDEHLTPEPAVIVYLTETTGRKKS